MLKDLFYLVKEYFFPVEYDEYGEPVKMTKDDIWAGIGFCVFMVELFFLYAVFA